MIPIACKFGRVATYGWRTRPGKSRGNFKNLYLYFNNIYDRQTWQGGELG